MAPPKVHLNIKELGIPSLTTFVHKLANGVARSMVTTTVHMWDTQKKRSKVIARETVGRIENGAPFGRIAFKPSFIERYPILKEVTVMRLNGYEYGYVKLPPPKNLTYESLMLKRGPKFQSRAAEKAAAERKAKKAELAATTATEPQHGQANTLEVRPKNSASTKPKPLTEAAPPTATPAKATAPAKAAQAKPAKGAGAKATKAKPAPAAKAKAAATELAPSTTATKQAQAPATKTKARKSAQPAPTAAANTLTIKPKNSASTKSKDQAVKSAQKSAATKPQLTSWS